MTSRVATHRTTKPSRRLGALGAILLTSIGLGVSCASAVAAVDPDLPTPGPHTLSVAGAAFITSDNNERLHLTPYGDPHCSIGYGHLIDLRRCSNPAVTAKAAAIATNFTKETALRYFISDTAYFSGCVNRAITVPLGQNAFDAMVSFAYNNGCSDGLPLVAAKINAGDYGGAADELRLYVWGQEERCVGRGKRKHCRWVKAKLAGLINRREDEAQKLLSSKLLPGRSAGSGDGGGQGTMPPTQPVLPTSSPPPAPCSTASGGGADVLLYGEFFGGAWASGEVTATSSDGTSESNTVGYDYVSMAHFGPWGCGATVTLTATPSRGNHFDRWESSEGICAGSGPVCTLPVSAVTRHLTAYFAPTVYQLSVTNEQPDGVVSSVSGNGYVYPGIDCGSIPNGPITEVSGECESSAIAQRDAEDVTELFVSPDDPGPGGDTYGIASIDGCDRSVALKAELPGGGGEYVTEVQCFIDMNSDRSVTVAYKDVGRG